MRRSRKEIDGGRFFDFISKFFEHGAVARERRGVAGDIHYPVGSHACGGFYRLLRAALARRVEDYHLRALALGEQLFRGFACVRADKPRVLYAVCGGVLLRVFYRRRDGLYADELLRLVCHRKPNRARAAVEVEQELYFFVSGVFGGFFV